MSRVALYEPEDIARAVADYERVHWGERGPYRAKSRGAPNPFYRPITELGELVAVVYRTKKGGDARREDYEHDFKPTRPILGFSSAGLFILGGTYTVTTDGIEG